MDGELMKSCPSFSIQREDLEKIRALIEEATEAFLGKLNSPGPTAILGYSTHRLEILSIIRHILPQVNLICLEEPYDGAIYRMLNGEIKVEDYVSERDFSFPDFQREFYILMKEMYVQGKEIIQIDPYMSCLMQIHEIFSHGGTHKDLPPGHYEIVYSTERAVSACLLKYYSLIPKGDFCDLLQAVMDFAKSDARRIKIRDEMRAEAIHQFLTKNPPESNFRRVYIEAGYIHQPLLKSLSHKLKDFKIIPYFPASPIVRFYTSKKHIFSPGDILTLRYAFKGNKGEAFQPDNIVLAARSLVYTKIITKDETRPSEDLPYPHTLDEIWCYKVVNLLSLSECSEIFNQIKYMKTQEARHKVLTYISKH